MNLVNITPHAIVIRVGTQHVTVPPSGQVARVATQTIPTGVVEFGGIEIPTYRQVAGDVTGLPDPQDDTIFVVSSMVRLASPGRPDVASPGELIRDAAGQPVGCNGLIF